MKKTLAIVIFSVLSAMLFIGCGGAKVYNVNNKYIVTQGLNKNEISNAIVKGATKARWTVRKQPDGKLKANYNRGKYDTTVEIALNKDNYSIKYLSSNGLKYDATKNTIHKTHNKLVLKLERVIDKYIAYEKRLKDKNALRRSNINAKYGGSAVAVNKNYSNGGSSYVSAGEEFDFKKAKKSNENSYALIIGINQYKENPAVEFADTSALAFKKLLNVTLGVPQENIITVLNDQATSGQLKAKIEQLKQLADKNGNIYLYFAGHGVPGKDGNSYILPNDMTADAIHLERNLKLDNIYSSLSKTSARNIFVFMDSCFSGKDDRGSLLYKGVAPVLKTKKTKLPSSKLTVFTAGTSKDFANDYQDKGHRMFTYFLVDELSKGDKNLNAVYAKVRKKVKKASLLKGLGYKQIPQIYGDSKKRLY
jgi:hypothetical protein